MPKLAVIGKDGTIIDVPLEDQFTEYDLTDSLDRAEVCERILVAISKLKKDGKW